MRLLKHKWIKEDIVLDKRTVNVLVLENHGFYRNFVMALAKQIEEGEDFLVFSQDLKGLDISKCAAILTDLFDIPIDEKKASTLIHKDLSKKMTGDMAASFQRLNSAMASFVDELVYDYPIPLTYSGEVELPALLKTIDVKPEMHSTDFLEALVTRIKTLANLMGRDLFFLLNLHDVLDKGELEKFYNEMRQLQVDIVAVDAREPVGEKDGHEKTIIIDRDLCEILK